MPEIDQAPKKDYKASSLFDELWGKSLERRVEAKTQGHQDGATVANIITHEIGEFMRTFPFQKRLKLKADVKDDAKATAARNRGNKRFAQRGSTAYMQAIPHYNESIAYSTLGSEARALAYGNRSAVCLKACMYEECLENIRLARASNYPTRLLEKLTQREQLVKRLLDEEKKYCRPSQKPTRTPGKFQPRGTDRPSLKLSYDAHANVPHLVRCVELRENDAFGRHLVTTQKLKAGDVLMIDTPYANLLLDLYMHVRCAYCHHEDPYTLIPCEGCSVAMYCSEECRTKAHQQYHRYECGVLHDCWRLVGDSERALLGLRTVARAFATHDKDLDGWAKHLDALDRKKVNACTINWKKATDTDIYDTVHALATNESLRNHRDMAKIVFFTTIMHRLMLERTEFGKVCKDKPARSKLLFDLLVRHWQTAMINSKRVMHVETKAIGGDDEFGEEDYYSDGDDDDDWADCDRADGSPANLKATMPALACYPLLSMLNHNCTPNVAPIFLHDGRCAIVAIRPIAANEQLFDHYGVSSLDLHPLFRYVILQGTYLFDCSCAACKTNASCSLAKTSAEEERLLRLFHVMGNEERQLPMLIEFMNRPGRRYPKARMTATQMKLLYLFRHLYNWSEQDEPMDTDQFMARLIFAGLRGQL